MYFLPCLLALLLLNDESSAAAVKSKKTKTAKSIDDFHLNLYKSVVASNPNDNVFLSPYSVGLALAMLAGGARGKTEKELLTVLQSSSRDKLDLSVKQLMKISRMPPIKLANRLYPDKEFPLLPAYTQRLQTIYNISVTPVDLNAKNTTPAISQINEWVSNQTDGHIKEALDKKYLATTPNALNALLLINCLFFDAKWQVGFDAMGTQEGYTFYPDTGPPQEKKLTLMSRRSHFSYVNLTSTIGAQMIHLPFENTDFTFTIILPNKGVTLAQVEARLTPTLLNSPTTSDRPVILRMPKWKFEFESEIKDVLKEKMKVIDVFDQTKANLKGLSLKNATYVSDVIHKTYVIVDEKGVRAAAVSIIRVMLMTSAFNPIPDIEFDCNKPFLYAIRYKQTTLFIGRYVKVIDTSNMPPIIDRRYG